MFITKTSEEEFFSDVKKNLNKLAHSEQARQTSNKEKVIAYLKEASVILKNNGFNKEAQIVDDVCDNTDPATSGLTSEKQVENLKQYGTPLNVNNADDDDEDEVII